MKRLLENELIFGRLMDIAEPHLVERYNRALSSFGLPQTSLTEFSIDMTGFSPQIAEALGDPLYLDPNAVNRRFIILSPAQENLPVVHTSFSNTAALMHQFFQENKRAIHAVTIRDVLYGEIEEDVLKVEDIEDLLSINEVKFKVLSADDMLGKSDELAALSDRLMTVPTAWRDDDMLNRMVALAQQTGDIRKNALVPDKVVFRHQAFWAGHFGGVFVFVDEKSTTVISDPAAPGFRRSRPWQVSYIALDDHKRIYSFLADTGRIETPQRKWIEKSGYLDHRSDMSLRWLIGRHEPETDLLEVDSIWLQTWVHRNADLVRRDGTYPFLQTARRHITGHGEMAMDDVAADDRFLLIRADPGHPDRWLTNQLISRLVPADFVSRFVFDKQGFYEHYETFDDTFRSFVVATLAEMYLPDKKALRRRLYGFRED